MYNVSNSFIFDGINSDEYNLFICEIDETPDYDTGLNRELKTSERTTSKPVQHQYGTQYTDNLEFLVTVVHKDGIEFSRQDTRSINSWLTHSSVPKILHFNNDDSMYVNYYATCTDIEDIVVADHIGKRITFKCNAPYGFLDKVSNSFSVTTEKVVKIKNDSDDGIYFPKVTIIPTLGTTQITIQNVTDSNSVVIKTTNYTKLILDSSELTVVDESGELVSAYDLGWTDTYTNSYGSNKIYWLRLLDGLNELKITGSCTFIIECEFPRKVGKM